MYNTCLTGVLKSKTRVLITNQLQFVSGADHILYMQDGHIEEQGTYDELMEADEGFAQLMSQAEVGDPNLATYLWQGAATSPSSCSTTPEHKCALELSGIN